MPAPPAELLPPAFLPPFPFPAFHLKPFPGWHPFFIVSIYSASSSSLGSTRVPRWPQRQWEWGVSLLLIHWEQAPSRDPGALGSWSWQPAWPPGHWEGALWGCESQEHPRLRGRGKGHCRLRGRGFRQRWDQQDQLLLLSPREIPEQFLPRPFSPSPRNVFFGYVKCQVNCNYTCQEVATQVQLCKSAVRKHVIKQAEMNFALYFIWL